MKARPLIVSALFVVPVLISPAMAQAPAGSAFTYQGRLSEAGAPATGLYDFQFTLYDAETDGNVVGDPDAVEDWPVEAGLFTVRLDFSGGVFDGQARWLDVALRPGASGGAYTTLAPRQELTPAPYALYALNGPGGESFWEAGTAGAIYYDGGNVGVGTTSPNARLNAYTFGTTALMGQSGSGLGVYGVSATNAGVAGINTTSGTFGKLGDPTYAVYGEKPDGFAGYFDGDVHVTGNLTLDGTFDADAWLRTGNAGTDPNVNFLGTTDNQPLIVKVNGGRALRLEEVTVNLSVPPDYDHRTGVNVLAGSPYNTIAPGAGIATIAGGGEWVVQGAEARGNAITALIGGTIGGGSGNTVAGTYGVVPGGRNNNASGSISTVGGGYNNNASGSISTVGGGYNNNATGDSSTVGGGSYNNATGYYSTVGGGSYNNATGYHSTVPGGRLNVAAGPYSFAAGYRAKVRSAAQVGDPNDLDGDEGTFIWADSTNADFVSNGPNKFLVRATGGVGIGTNDPSNQLTVSGDADFTGNVGIGLTNPSEKLDTSGTARLRGIGTGTGTAVVADANGKLWKQSSSRRYKHHVADLPPAGDAVLDLRPVSFAWNSTGAPDIGLIAEDVEQVLPDLVIRDADGRPDGVRYDKVSLCLLGVVKDQRVQLATQQAQIEAQQDELTSLRARLEKIEALLAGHATQPTGGVR